MLSKLKMILKKEELLLKMNIITICMVLFYTIISIGNIVELRNKIILLSLIPLVIYFNLTLLMYLFYDKKLVKKILYILIVIFLVLTVFYNMFLFAYGAIQEGVNPVTDIKYYKYHNVGIFPKEIPKTARNVRFYYRSPFLQGGKAEMLYYIDKNSNLKKIDKKYRKQAKWIGNINDKDRKIVMSTFFYNTNIKYEDENSFIIYLISSDCDNSGYCNHGSYSAIAINEKTNEIIFKEETW